MPRRRVLIVEDDESSGRAIQRALERHGWVPRIACDAGAAMRIATEQLPAIALVDNRLPDGDGVGVAKELRRIAGERPLAIALVSGSGDDAFEPGVFDAVLPKPFELDALYAMLDRLAAR